MRLADWLTENDLDRDAFARRIDRTSESVRRYLSGERIPDKDTMTAIFTATDGKVAPNDFYQLPIAA